MKTLNVQIPAISEYYSNISNIKYWHNNLIGSSGGKGMKEEGRCDTKKIITMVNFSNYFYICTRNLIKYKALFVLVKLFL